MLPISIAPATSDDLSTVVSILSEAASWLEQKNMLGALVSKVRFLKASVLMGYDMLGILAWLKPIYNIS
jgi:hypothetical protein